MNHSIDTDQKQQLAAWNKRCGILWLKYFAIVLVPLFILMLPFFQVLNYFLDVNHALAAGELAFGQPGYYESQAAKDQALIILAVLVVLAAAHYYLCNRWCKKAIRTLGPPPGKLQQVEPLGTRKGKGFLEPGPGHLPHGPRHALPAHHPAVVLFPAAGTTPTLLRRPSRERTSPNPTGDFSGTGGLPPGEPTGMTTVAGGGPALHEPPVRDAREQPPDCWKAIALLRYEK